MNFVIKMDKSRCTVVSLGGYEGGLLGLSLQKGPDGKLDLKDLQTEYAFNATEGSILCAEACQGLMALGGYDEVIRLFDVQKKKDLGDLVGDHNGTITAL